MRSPSDIFGAFGQNRVGETLSALSSNEELRLRLARLQGRDRPERAQTPDFEQILLSAAFRQIEAVGQFWQDRPDGVPVRAMATHTGSLLRGMAATQTPCLFLLSGLKKRLSVYVGTAPQAEESLDLLLQAHFPGASLATGIGDHVLEQVPRLPYCHLISGVPWHVPEPCDGDVLEERIDRLVRGLLYGAPWALLILGQPLPPAQGEELVDRWSDTVERATVEFHQPGTLGELSRLGELYLELLEVQLERALRGRTHGNWLTETYLLSETPAAAGLAVAVLSSEESRPEPLRAIPCDTRGRQTNRPVANATWLSSLDLSSLIQFPVREYPGYAVETVARFDVNPPDGAKKSAIKVAWIEDLGVATGEAFAIDQDRLASHALIAGTTGSGKTNSVFHLLHQLHEQDIPFLVIEPVKGEYRSLQGAFPEMNVLTLGSNEAPVRVNPFYVAPGIPVQTHVDYLLSLFAASFVLYAPMPYVLESALHEVYEDKGWDLVNDLCTRDSGRPERAFPTMTDLYHKVDEVVDRLGYGARIDRDVRAALRARLNSLRVGVKGAMLDTRVALDIEQLLTRPQVVEMKAIGNDEQKAFLMGLLLTLIYEHYRAQGVELGKERLGHVTVIEEAHRLVENVVQEGNRDFANPKAEAVQTFSNIIAEIRAYGEGLIIVEQSPVKLAPDVLKNTNLKMAHRIISRDDREALAGAMPLGEEQQEVLVKLKRGHVVLFTGGMDRPVLARVPEAKTRMTSPEPPSMPGDETVTRKAVGVWGRQTLTDKEQVRAAFARWFVSSVLGDPEDEEESRDSLVSLMRSSVPVALRTPAMEKQMVSMAVPRLADWLATEMGTMYSWPFELEERVCEAAREQWPSTSRSDELADLLADGTSVAIRPFDACQLCETPCLFRFFARLAVDVVGKRENTMELLNQYSRSPTEGVVRQLALHGRLISRSTAQPGIPRVSAGVALCSLILAAHAAEWPASVVSEMAESVHQRLS